MVWKVRAGSGPGRSGLSCISLCSCGDTHPVHEDTLRKWRYTQKTEIHSENGTLRKRRYIQMTEINSDSGETFRYTEKYSDTWRYTQIYGYSKKRRKMFAESKS
jgi:hypothetical protein